MANITLKIESAGETISYSATSPSEIEAVAKLLKFLDRWAVKKIVRISGVAEGTRIAGIKLLREIYDLDLKTAKDLSDLANANFADLPSCNDEQLKRLKCYFLTAEVIFPYSF